MHFSSYMTDWLYGEDGYYTNFKAIGKSGDFYTAVSTSAFFGASIANYLVKLLDEDSSKTNGWLVEIGAHQGYLLCDMIQWIYTVRPKLLETMRFGIVEKHPKIRQAQLSYIHKRFGDEVKVHHFASISELKADYAFIVSNEIFDAFPCELLKDGKIAKVDDHVISWEDATSKMLQWAEKHHLKVGEVAVGYEDFAKEIAALPRCDFVSFDYGEAYVRNDFSIRIYEEHQTFPLFDEKVNLEKSFKKADITYDVNFAHVIEAFEAVGFTKVQYETQARALVRFGIIYILGEFAKQTTQERYAREADKIKTLLAPTIMGDRFKMVHLVK
ncbi:MAG: SAM-dependent methyltransferase [Sulfurovaceae bacterium]